MEKIIFEKDSPVGEVLIEKTKIQYITDMTFHTEGVYEELIDTIEKTNKDKILIIVNDNSNHGFVKRCYIRVFNKNELCTI